MQEAESLVVENITSVKRGGTFKDRAGQRHGRWTFIRPGEAAGRNKNTKWLARCDCGTEKWIVPKREGTSCGCRKSEVTSKRNKTHGKSHLASYNVWLGMIRRCTNPKDRAYAWYGARGISVCEHWLKVENFIEDMGEPPNGMEIERIDNNGNYAPDNCRWASRSEQCRNTRHNRIITHKGETMCLTSWAERVGIDRNRIGHRINSGWTIDEAFYTPKNSPKCHDCPFPKTCRSRGCRRQSSS